MIHTPFIHIATEDLSEDQVSEELSYIAHKMAEYDMAYYQKDAPMVDDATYDAYRLRNEAIEKKWPHLQRKDSPSLRLGAAPLEAFDKVTHAQPMLSLSNVFSEQEIVDFMDKSRRFLSLAPDEVIDVVVEPKVDGLSLSLRYEKGCLTQAATRGDGTIGENVTDNIRTIASIPLYIEDAPDILEVRGEVYMSKSSFEKLNRKQQDEAKAVFANPRNAAAGSLRQLDSQITAQRDLDFQSFGIGQISQDIASDWWGILDWLHHHGFKRNDLSAKCASIEDILKAYDHIETLRAHLNYDIDGVVYKINRLDWQNRLGQVSRSPRWSVAHKFAAEKGQTQVEKITFQVGRTGVLTPVAHLAPVTIGGVVVRRASLHNMDEIGRLDIREGDHVIVQRAGDVIPQIVQVIVDPDHDKRPIVEAPKQCPQCARAVEQIVDQVAIRCSGGFFCPAQRLQKMRYFVSKDALNMDGLGIRQLEQLINEGYIQNPADIFKLHQYKDEIISLEGWGEKSMVNLLDSIEKRRHIDLDRFIIGLGITVVGAKNAKLLAQHFQTDERLIEGMFHLLQEDIEAEKQIISIDGIGQTVIHEMKRFFRDPYNQQWIDQLRSEITIHDYILEKTDSLFSEKTIVFTGTLQQLSRREAKALAERLGAKISSAVSAKTDYVIAGEKSGSKAKKAQELGVQILSEEAFLTMIETASNQ